MCQKVYVAGYKDTEDNLCLPLVSTAVLFVSRYCLANHFKYFIVNSEQNPCSDKYVTVSSAIVQGLDVEFIEESCVPSLVNNCVLPVSTDEVTIRSGLCGTVRHIIQLSHDHNPAECFNHLLGFRNGSLRMCAEVSGWTKLCEVELPQSVSNLIQTIRKVKSKADLSDQKLELPVDLIKVEMHFDKPPKVHNDHKIKKQIIIQNRNDILNPQSGRKLLESCNRNRTDSLYERDVALDHGLRRYRIYQNIDNKLYLKSDRAYVREREYKNKPKDKERPITLPKRLTDEERAAKRKEKKKRKLERRALQRSEEIAEEREKLNLIEKNFDKLELQSQDTDHSELDKNDTDLSSAIKPSRQVPYTIDEIIASFKTISTLDVEFIHLYSEGLEMTVADLILFVYLYFLMIDLNFQTHLLMKHVPNITAWLHHMISLDRMKEAMKTCQFVWKASTGEDIGGDVIFTMPTIPVFVEDKMELNRRNKSSIRALKPEVIECLNMIQNADIKVIKGEHPCKDNITIDWTSLPSSAHPQEGDVPAKRIERKCQQLENLVTAVTSISKDNDIIVDFCSGGGHLGIVLAYLLPKCKIYLIENKEESIERARSRIATLKLSNVIIYQCNLDYFHGYFHIGVCLHACGVATDMVLHQCLNNKASFVICPCCYGGIVKTHKISYPASELFQNAGLSYKDFVTLGHAADQTEFNMALSNQGCYCANLVDTDRAELAKQYNYTVNLCSLQPLSCTPKNNLLIGIPN